MFEKNQAIKLIIDPENGFIIEANAAAQKFYGYTYQSLISKRISDINIFSEEDIFSEMRLAKEEKRLFFNFQHKIASGEIKNVEVYSGPIMVAGKTLLYSIVQDVTNKKQIENVLKETEQRFRDLFNNIEAQIFIKDLQGRYLFVNEKFLHKLGKTAKEIIGKYDLNLYPERLAKDFKQADENCLKAKQSITTETRLQNEASSQYFSTVKFSLKNPSGEVYAVCGICTDITEKKCKDEKIIHQAHFDALTHLPNRFLSLDRLDQMVKEAQRSDEKVAVLFLDLDDFKKINDSLGHEVGDKLLIESAKRLNQVIRNEDTVGRLGGDEFIMLLRGIHHNSDAQPVTDALV